MFFAEFTDYFKDEERNKCDDNEKFSVRDYHRSVYITYCQCMINCSLKHVFRHKNVLTQHNS